MKKLSLLLGILFIGIVVRAHSNHGKSNLNIKLWNNSSFKVILNNQAFNKTTFFSLNDLTPGIHHLKIIKHRRNYYGNGGLRQVLFNGTIKIPKRSMVTATITPSKNMKVHVTKRREHFHGKYGHHNGNYGSSFYGRKRGYGQQHNCNSGNCCTSNNSFNFHQGGFGSSEWVMSQSSFNRLINTMENEPFDDSRLAIVQAAMKHNNFNTDQVIILMDMFTFDSAKLSFAKMAFSQTIDKENYYLVSNGFTFSRSKNKLNAYIAQYG